MCYRTHKAVHLRSPPHHLYHHMTPESVREVHGVKKARSPVPLLMVLDEPTLHYTTDEAS